MRVSNYYHQHYDILDNGSVAATKHNRGVGERQRQPRKKAGRFNGMPRRALLQLTLSLRLSIPVERVSWLVGWWLVCCGFTHKARWIVYVCSCRQ